MREWLCCAQIDVLCRRVATTPIDGIFKTKKFLKFKKFKIRLFENELLVVRHVGEFVQRNGMRFVFAFVVIFNKTSVR